MHYVCLAFDFDGTLANESRVPDDVLQALSRIKQSGRYLVLVTGRRLDELLKIFPHVALFDQLVCENGAILYNPATKTVKLLAEPPSQLFIDRLRSRGVSPIDEGKVILATWHPHETAIVEVIQEMGLDLHISFNKGAVMILPPGVNKGTGLREALSQLGLSPHNAIGVGDAENDHALFSAVECGVAVSNALPTVKEHADLVMRGDHGHGVIELIDRVLNTDLDDLETFIDRHKLTLGTTSDGKPIKFDAYNCRILIAGPSKSGKSTVSMSLLDRFASAGYQYCVIDPEGEYHRAPRAITVGNEHYAPSVDDILRALSNPDDNVVVNLLSVELSERPAFLGRLTTELQEMRRKNGRPHWIVIDEAHHMLHPYWDETLEPDWREPGAMVLITVDPKEISSTVLSGVDIVLAVGHDVNKTLNCFAERVGHKPAVTDQDKPGWGRAIAWFRREYSAPIDLILGGSPVEHQRHMRKYATGDIGNQRSFYFTGPENRFKIRCQNLFLFVQIADGLDDATWSFHLHRGDFSNWFRNVIRDSNLADETSRIETNNGLPASESRRQIRDLIERRYSPPIRLLG